MIPEICKSHTGRSRPPFALSRPGSDCDSATGDSGAVEPPVFVSGVLAGHWQSQNRVLRDAIRLIGIFCEAMRDLSGKVHLNPDNVCLECVTVSLAGQRCPVARRDVEINVMNRRLLDTEQRPPQQQICCALPPREFFTQPARNLDSERRTAVVTLRKTHE